MSNPHDDPGHRRPPPPRQGEPISSSQGASPPHPGEVPPYYEQQPPYQGPPHQPGAPAWQGQPAYGFPPQIPVDAAPRRKGIFRGLFDPNFDEMVTPRLIKIFYALAVALISLGSLFELLVGLWALQFDWGRYFGVFLVPAAPLTWLLGLLFTRITLEFIINQFKITEYLKAIREREER